MEDLEVNWKISIRSLRHKSIPEQRKHIQKMKSELIHQFNEAMISMTQEELLLRECEKEMAELDQEWKEQQF